MNRFLRLIATMCRPAAPRRRPAPLRRRVGLGFEVLEGRDLMSAGLVGSLAQISPPPAQVRAGSQALVAPLASQPKATSTSGHVAAPTNAQTVLVGGRYLSPGYSIKSPNGQYTLSYQKDGNFVLYGPGNRALWHSGTYGRTAGKAIMQTDGNLVVYDRNGRAVWSSGTWGRPGARLALQNDGNLVIYDRSGRALWSTGTYGGRSNVQPPQTVLFGGQQLNPGSSIKSPNGQYTLTYQKDGNFVLYGPGNRALWHSGTYGRSAGKAIMQADGNLVVYDRSGRAVWNSGTWGRPGARLALQNDGNLVIYDTGGRALWSSGTYGGRSTIQPPNPFPGLPDISGTWRSQYGTAQGVKNTVTLTRSGNGYVVEYRGTTNWVGNITLEGKWLVLRKGSTIWAYAYASDVTSNRINWTYETQWDEWSR